MYIFIVSTLKHHNIRENISERILYEINYTILEMLLKYYVMHLNNDRLVAL